MPQLTNQADATAEYQSVPVEASTTAVVELNAIEMTKTPNKPIWIDGQLGYTITVENLDDTTPGDPIENLVVTDIIDPEIATYVAGSALITIDGTPVPGAVATFDSATGLLTVTVGSVPAGETVTIFFLVDKV